MKIQINFFFCLSNVCLSLECLYLSVLCPMFVSVCCVFVCLCLSLVLSLSLACLLYAVCLPSDCMSYVFNQYLSVCSLFSLCFPSLIFQSSFILKPTNQNKYRSKNCKAEHGIYLRHILTGVNGSARHCIKNSFKLKTNDMHKK